MPSKPEPKMTASVVWVRTLVLLEALEHVAVLKLQLVC